MKCFSYFDLNFNCLILLNFRKLYTLFSELFETMLAIEWQVSENSAKSANRVLMPLIFCMALE